MNDRKVRGHEVRAVLFRRGKAEDVVVLVDGAPHRAEGVMTVGQSVRERKFFQTARLRRLNDPDVGDIVRGDGVELDLQIFFVALVVRAEDLVSHRPLLRLLLSAPAVRNA